MISTKARLILTTISLGNLNQKAYIGVQESHMDQGVRKEIEKCPPAGTSMKLQKFSSSMHQALVQKRSDQFFCLSTGREDLQT